MLESVKIWSKLKTSSQKNEYILTFIISNHIINNVRYGGKERIALSS